MQAKRAHARAVPETSTKILLPMRQRWSPDERMPSEGGRSLRGRGKHGREFNSEPRITFTPRPHIKIDIQGRSYNALLDGGSEISLINLHTSEALSKKGFETKGEKGVVSLANGSTGETQEYMELPLRVGNRTMRHRFFILSYMEDKIIIGIDLQYRLRLGIPPPPKYVKKWLPKCSTIGGSAVQTLDEEKQLQRFLREKLQKFRDPRANQQSGTSYTAEGRYAHQTEIPATQSDHASNHQQRGGRNARAGRNRTIA